MDHGLTGSQHDACSYAYVVNYTAVQVISISSVARVNDGLLINMRLPHIRIAVAEEGSQFRGN